MSATPLEKATNILKYVSVATLATALFKRGLRNQVIQGVRPVRSHHNLLDKTAAQQIWWACLYPSLHARTRR